MEMNERQPLYANFEDTHAHASQLLQPCHYIIMKVT